MWGWGPAGRQRAVCTKTSQQASHPPFGMISLLMILSQKVKTSLPARLALPTCDGALSVCGMPLLPSGLQAGSSGMCRRGCRNPLLPADGLRCPRAQVEEVEGRGSLRPSSIISAPRGTRVGPGPVVSTIRSR